MIYVPQIETSDCGLACLKTILCTVHKDKNYMYMPQKVSAKGTSYSDLIKLAAKHNVQLEAFEVADKSELLKCTTLPVIIALKYPDGRKHSVVIEKIKRNKLKIYDPDCGVYETKLQEIENEWDGIGLAVMSYEKTESPYTKKEVFNKKDNIIPNFLQIVSGILVALGIYYINPEKDLILPIIFLSASILVAIIMKLVVFQKMKKYDALLIESADKINNKQYFNYYEQFEKAKGFFFSNTLNIIYYCLIVVFIIFVTIFNDLRYFLIMMEPILVGAVEFVFINPSIKKKNCELELIEATLHNVNSKDDFEMKVKTIHDKSYNFAKIVSFKRAIRLFIFAAFAIVEAYIVKQTSIVDILFMIFLECFLFDNIVPIFSYEENENEYLKNQLIMNNLLSQNENMANK